MTCDERTDSIALINGAVYPMTAPGRSDAVYARGGVIRAIGKNNDILSMCDSKTVVLDMKGKSLLPGFTDTHTHLLEAGRSSEIINLRGALSINQIIERGRKFISENKQERGAWITACGWDQDLLSDKRYPTRKDLDKISKDLPLFFQRVCGHIAVLNTKALQLLGISGSFKIPGGIVGTDEQGEANGVVCEAAAAWVRMNMPAHTDEELGRWYKKATDDMLRYGITSVQTDDISTAGSIKRVFELYEKIELADDMPLRVTEQWVLNDERQLVDFIEAGYHKRHGAEYFKSGPLKINVDGTLGARTAALREEYSDDPCNRGIYAHSQEELDRMVTMAQSAGMQVAFFAIGDGAIERCLNSVEAANKNAPYSKIHHRIVHCQVGAPDIFKRMAELGVYADIQPAFVSSDWPIVMPRLGAERSRSSYAWKSLILNGITLGAGSAAPGESMNPFVGIKSAILRQDENCEPLYGWMPSQRLDRVEAFTMYTAGGAAVCGEGETRGTLAVGHAADIVAFMDNPFIVPEEDLTNMSVGLVIVGGKIRYIK